MIDLKNKAINYCKEKCTEIKKKLNEKR